MKITQKLLLTITVLLIGFVVIGLVYRQVLQIEAQARERNASTSLFAQLAQKIQIDLQGAQLEYDNFALTKDLESLEGFESSILSARDDLANLRERSSVIAETVNEETEGVTGTRGDTQLLADLTEKMDALYRVVYNTAELQIALGLDEQSGLQGELRESMHEVESILAAEIEAAQTAKAGLEGALNMQQLRASMLQIRRHEKDFLLRRSNIYIDRLTRERETFASLVEESSLSEVVKQALTSGMADYSDTMGTLADTVVKLQAALGLVNTTAAAIPPLLDEVLMSAESALQVSARRTEEQTTNATRVFVGALIAVGVIAAVVLLLLSSGITRSLGVLQHTVRQVTGGDMEARSKLTGSDELHSLGKAFDNLLDERMATQAAAERENEELNESIIELLQGVAQLSQKDLTVKLTVGENVTGPVADSLNLFTDETAKVLRRVTRISDDVSTASNTVKGQTDTVMALADNERQQVVQTSGELAAAAEAMNEIAELAQASNRAADEAINRTRAALETVTNTVSGINATRDTIRETEKRIKRLGERSQEITGAVNLINNIAERTHILALNASMHAASAGEAGRGFAVVADEVQRLAENARQATEQISNLVSNIQIETQDTVATMNTAISQVVDGSRLAEQAGERMQETQVSTAALVGSVQRIAESSRAQAKISNALRGRARQIEESTEKTSEELQRQGVQTSMLLDYSQGLLESVRVFTLPADEESAIPDVQETQLKVVNG